MTLQGMAEFICVSESLTFSSSYPPYFEEEQLDWEEQREKMSALIASAIAIVDDESNWGLQSQASSEPIFSPVATTPSHCFAPKKQ